MSLLDVKNLTFSYGQEPLYLHASMRLFANEHAVLVGPNGSGKSTLLKLIEKQLRPDKGQITWLPNKKIGYLDQYQKLNLNQTVKHYLYDVFLPLFEKEKEMETLYHQASIADSKDQSRYLQWASDLQEQLMEDNFYQIKSQIGNVIHGLGLEMSVLDQPFKYLSGGMRAKIILGKLLLEEADVLLLDEPTNFLDVKHIEWLIKFLNQYEKAFIVVSHHEEFLSSIAQTVFAIEGQKIERYKGDFNFYLKERELRHRQQTQAFVNQQKLIEKTEAFIQKNIVRASTTKRAQSRRKMLKKIERIRPPQQSRVYHFRFPFSKTTGKDVFHSKALEIGYDEPLIEPLDFAILKEDKVVITGKNGVGKTSFLKTILGIIPALSGSFHWIDTADIAYFSQDETYDEMVTPFQYIHHLYPRFTKKEIYALLGAHGISYEMAERPLKKLSGGEQTKVRLAKLRHHQSNVLIMDEPTNHLDVEAKEALKEALIEYEGTLILVSHEKEFYEAICDYEISLYESD
ncbi:MAG: ABC-F family ATP-binding cassette domain-containing protein [Acholeplasmataceae bacterium]|nr:ATP-binding cassette domain-containing protein [Acholeplasmataceae bacterium]